MPFLHHPNQIEISQNEKLWRYMDFEKYKSLLERKALFFCRADKFVDHFEGSLLKREAEHRMAEEISIAKHYNRPFDEEKARKNVQDLSRYHRTLKRAWVINCWHINDHESDAMWRLYLKTNDGVAIQTNSARIEKAIAVATYDIGMSKVRYLNYEEDAWYHPQEYPHTQYNFVTPFVHKRFEFKHENEFRLYHEIDAARKNASFWDTQENVNGLFVEVDVATLIEKVILHPHIDKQAEEAIVKVTKQYGFDLVFEKSKLQSDPYY